MRVKTIYRAVASVLLMAVATVFSLNVQAGVIKSWNLTNKSPGALGGDYGLRLNGLSGITGTDIMIFDFERPGVGVRMDLIDNAGDLSMHLYGTAFGAAFDSSAGDKYGTQFAGIYNLDFTWIDVALNVGSFEYLAENGIGMKTIGSSTGSVIGDYGNIALASFSGKYGYTLDVDMERANPNASGWLKHNNGVAGGGYDGPHSDFGFSMVEVPEPGVFSLLAVGLLGLALQRRALQ